MFVTIGTKQESGVANKATGTLCRIVKGYECCSFTKKARKREQFYCIYEWTDENGIDILSNYTIY